MTQHKLITAHIDTFGSITPMEAFSEYGITKLATRVSELRRQGEPIVGEMVTGTNRFGGQIRFMKYRRAQ